MADAGLFEAVIVDRELPQDARVPQLIAWAAKCSQLGFTPSYGPGDHGNLSCRTSRGLVISARATVKAHLRAEQFVEVVGVDQADSTVRVRCRGQLLPSTDALLHWRIYRVRPEIGAILHGHDPATLAKAHSLHLAMTVHSALVQSMEVVEEVSQLAAGNNYILLRDHGFVALGRSVQEAGELVEAWAQRAQTVSEIEWKRTA